jgi:dGTPase
LGHTPFGHIGGDVLDALLREDDHPLGFEHNFQSFRVLTKLEKRYKDFDGLNLTFATLEGVLKHSYPYKKKFLENIDLSFDLDKHPSLEAIVVDHADEIAYTSHDIDDGIKYGLISFDDLMDDELSMRVDEMVREEGVSRGESLYRHRFVAALIKMLVEDFITYSKEGAESYREDTPISSTLNATLKLPLGFSSTTETQLKKLKKLLHSKLYKHQKISEKMYAGKQCIKGLYRAFRDDNDLLPKKAKNLMAFRNEHRVIADYIASMTDRYALKSYQSIYGLSLY